jgi:hypothetical protein
MDIDLSAGPDRAYLVPEKRAVRDAEHPNVRDTVEVVLDVIEV